MFCLTIAEIVAFRYKKCILKAIAYSKEGNLAMTFN